MPTSHSLNCFQSWWVRFQEWHKQPALELHFFKDIGHSNQEVFLVVLETLFNPVLEYFSQMLTGVEVRQCSVPLISSVVHSLKIHKIACDPPNFPAIILPLEPDEKPWHKWSEKTCWCLNDFFFLPSNPFNHHLKSTDTFLFHPSKQIDGDFLAFLRQIFCHLSSPAARLAVTWITIPVVFDSL